MNVSQNVGAGGGGAIEFDITGQHEIYRMFKQLKLSIINSVSKSALNYAMTPTVKAVKKNLSKSSHSKTLSKQVSKMSKLYNKRRGGASIGAWGKVWVKAYGNKSITWKNGGRNGSIYGRKNKGETDKGKLYDFGILAHFLEYGTTRGIDAKQNMYRARQETAEKVKSRFKEKASRMLAKKVASAKRRGKTIYQ